ncbi:hypothetical protein [Streptomyces sp. NBC_00448]|uniref:hypothetical protein n=1 Tax=Streptomyces sp. NBC_00448 TaxID=2903652 RepID=UPI002E243232
MNRRLPWWSWGFVVGGVAGFLGLVTHWFSTVPPSGAPLGTGGHGYGAFSVHWLGALGPVFMLLEGGRWFGALRGWWRVPALSDWRRGGSRPADRTAPVASAASPASPASPTSPASSADSAPQDDGDPGEGAGPGGLIGLAALILLGISRAAVPTHLTVFAIGGTDPGRRDMAYAVHVDFGFWCMLVGSLLFVACGALGWFTRERIFRPSSVPVPD